MNDGITALIKLNFALLSRF